MSKIERPATLGHQPLTDASGSNPTKDLGTVGHLNGSPAPPGTEQAHASKWYVPDMDSDQSGMAIAKRIATDEAGTLKGMAFAKGIATDEAGTLKMESDLLRMKLENSIDPGLGKQPQGVKWEGPDFDAIKKK